MATNKNQHYVPQCYLRRFAPEGVKAAINLLNIDREKIVQNAPIKNQCSKSYFYGEDLQLEKALQPIEGRYSGIIDKISKPGYKLNDEDRLFLKKFWLLQNLRTEASSRRNLEMTENMGEVAGIDAQEYKMELKEAVQLAMSTFFEQINIVDDLKICLLKNKSKEDFITSDDPAILTNRWYLKDKRTKGESFGLGSAGNLIFLPLTPKIMCLGYDSDVYSITHKNGWVDVRSDKCVKSLNEHQVLNCRANLFFKEINKKDQLSAFLSMHKGNRPEARHRINYAVLEEHKDGCKIYKSIKREDADEHEEAIMHCQMLNATPSAWSLFLRWRNRGFVYTNGSGVGYIRESQVSKMPSNDFRKEAA